MFTRILSQISRTTYKREHLIVSKRLPTSAFAINAVKYLCACGHMQTKAALCAQSHTVRQREHTHAHACLHIHIHIHVLVHTHTHCLFAASASFLPLHADCVSGTEVKVWSHTQAVCSVWLLHTVNGLYEWLGLND